MASRGGYGLSRLLDAIDWPLLARAVEQGTRWVGHSDFTALQLGLLAHTGAGSWAGPMAADDFGRADIDGGVDDVTAGCFTEAMSGELEAVGFRTAAGYDGLQVRGPLWGGNLTMLCSLLGTPHLPRPRRVKGGVLFLEDVNEHPYRVERMLLQLLQAGVLGTQRRCCWATSAAQAVAQRPGLPAVVGGRTRAPAQRRAHADRPAVRPRRHQAHVPVGRKVTLAVQGRDVLLGW
jgi:muramoyltetrapeptide carboxypeptidase